ncbi:uracil-DNA glycosylase family protein [Halocalculus aciditolerans]|uniref:Uracil-DNA glycosylase-like domain-containing protein n=1 Tax=Halocalculus aciditolerans TaxID=1383812 RepID=A0A830FCF9_9EURY|nr:uracil-DNA glycosylase family protein [Halocalculus aciditolerans]GGL60687.1 hypothetical protein GCM10009039_18700 [Halocalculus aciditolerans]
MQNVTDRTSNPFGMSPPGDRVVHGYGDANADFHVVGDHPGVHGGVDTGIPFTGTAAVERFWDALAAVGLAAAEPEPTLSNCFASYLHAAVPDADGAPTSASYDRHEAFFDSELRAITAHVLLPVGERATRHVLEQYTPRPAALADDLDAIHGEELSGSGFLVVPAKDPADWTGSDFDDYVDGVERVMSWDYRRESDLGRFLPGDETYTVR